jgi:YfiH family protein
MHAGWRSTKENIVEKTLKLMQEKFGIKTADLCLAFGPCIRGCCYEVGKDFKNFFPYDTIQRSGKLYFNLISANKREFLNQGIREKNIVDCGICTVCNNKDFLSYRREGENCGRVMSIIMLK